MHNIQTQTVAIGGKEMTFETGKLALQAQGAVKVTHGETVLLVTCGVGAGREGIDFFPLVVDFEPKYYATGKIKGSRFMKREARPPESAILTSRMIDRTMRPLFEKGITNEVQVIGNLLQSDGLRNVGPTAITAASCAVQLSGMPIEAAFAGVRVGMVDGAFVLDPTFDEVKEGGMDLIVAGTADAITMVEAGMNLVEDAVVLDALAFAHDAIKQLCDAQEQFKAKHTIKAIEPTRKEKKVAEVDAVAAVITQADLDTVRGGKKQEVKDALHVLEDKLKEHYAEQIEAGELDKGALMSALDKAFAARMRARVFESGERLDGRGLTDVRDLYCEVGILPRVHGSALFQRGETQALTLTTVGGPTDVKIIDDADRPEFTQNYIHHYNFPPYSVGEVRRLRSPGRREIGHGFLAQRALEPVIPTKEEDLFPYTLRLVSEILTCNGSSSMASVCGSTLSLMDAGIQIKRPISGVAMGLLTDKETGDYRILSDIQSFEDFDGDMDLKVTGDNEGITALQMDIKVKGLKLELLKEALMQAKEARITILEAMLEAIPQPREEMNAYAPRVTTMKINPDYIRVVIGKGGETIQGLCAEYDVKIDIEDDGTVMIQSTDQAKAKGAENAIAGLVYEPEIGDVFDNGIVKSVKDFGIFVEFLPGKEALVHVSEMANTRVENPADIVSEGDTVKVKLIGKDRMGRMKLTMKDA